MLLLLYYNVNIIMQSSSREPPSCSTQFMTLSLPLLAAALSGCLSTESLTACLSFCLLTTGNNSQEIKSGDFVLVYDVSPRTTWKLAIVEGLITGKDGLVCAANIKTPQGRTNLPIAKMIPLEVSTPTSTETDKSKSSVIFSEGS